MLYGLGKLGLDGGVHDREARLGTYQNIPAINAERTEVVASTTKHHACGQAPATKRLARSSSTRAASEAGGVGAGKEAGERTLD